MPRRRERLSRCARDDHAFGERSFDAPIVDRTGALADLRTPRTCAREVADHREEFRVDAEELLAALAAFSIRTRQREGWSSCTTLTMPLPRSACSACHTWTSLPDCTLI
jgi:hypothetical protein